MPIIHFIQSMEDRPESKEPKKDENKDEDDIFTIVKQASK